MGARPGGAGEEDIAPYHLWGRARAPGGAPCHSREGWGALYTGQGGSLTSLQHALGPLAWRGAWGILKEG